MARKGYASSNKEKIIYDNTVFRGVSATTDPNPEGYFKQLINFDISDTGQSLQPRKGFLNTSFHLCQEDPDTHEITYPYVNLHYDSTIYYLDHTTGSYFFIDFWKYNLPFIVRTLKEEVKDAKEYCYKRLYALLHGGFEGAPSTYDAAMAYYTSVVTYIKTSNRYNVLFNETNDTFPKAVDFINKWMGDGCVQQTLYNTFYYAEHMTDISEASIRNSVNNIFIPYYTDAAIDAAALETYGPTYAFIYRTAPNTSLTEINESTKYLIVEPVTNIIDKAEDIETIVYLRDYLDINKIENIEPIENHCALYAKDYYGIDRNIIKVHCTDNNVETHEPFFIEFKYNSDENAILITVLDTDNTVSYNMVDRNIASDKSVIPDPMYKIYDDNEEAFNEGKTYSQFPFIFKSKEDENNKKYLLQYTDTLDYIKIEPNFYLLEPEEGYKWVYTYDIYSTSKITNLYNTEDNTSNADYISYSAPIFDLNNSILWNGSYFSLLDYSELSTISILKDGAFDSGYSYTANGTYYINSYANQSSVNITINHNQCNLPVNPTLSNQFRIVGTTKLENNINLKDGYTDSSNTSRVWQDSILDDYIIYILPSFDTTATKEKIQFNSIYTSSSNGMFHDTDTYNSTTCTKIDPYDLLFRLFRNYNISGEYYPYIPATFDKNTRNYTSSVFYNKTHNINTIEDLISLCTSDYKDNFVFYIVKIDDIKNTLITDEGATLYNNAQTALNSGVLIWKGDPTDDKHPGVLTADEFYEQYLKQYDKEILTNEPVTLTIRPMYTRYTYDIYNNIQTLLNIWRDNIDITYSGVNTAQTNVPTKNQIIQNIELYFPDIFETDQLLVYKDLLNDLLILDTQDNTKYNFKSLDDNNVICNFICKRYFVYTSCTSSSLPSALCYYNKSHNDFILKNLFDIKSIPLVQNSNNAFHINDKHETISGTTYTINMSKYLFVYDSMYIPLFMSNNCTQNYTSTPSGTYATSTTGYANSITSNYYKTILICNLDASVLTAHSLSLTITKQALNGSSTLLHMLNQKHFFDNGLTMAIYLAQVPTIGTITSLPDLSLTQTYTRSYIVNSTSLFNSVQVILKPNTDNDETNQINVALNGPDEDPAIIKEGKNYCIFYSIEGYRLVVWSRNNVYMSEAGQYYYFKSENKKSYAERVVKVLPFKDMLLVFTTQNMYSIYPYEQTLTVQDGVDDEGNAKYVQQKVISYATLPVLYNLYTDEKYKDVIQVYNGMILFYSSDGQLYLISPSTQIDSDTQFSLKFINKAANDILLNYDKYINKRLSLYYNAPDFNPVSKDDDSIIITASVSVSQIKIYYTVPKYTYTYILIYDITNNRYTVYDTPAFGTIQNIVPTELYETIITRSVTGDIGAVLPYTEPNVPNNNCDLTSIDNYVFIQHDILTELDTGVLYLNNQWKKRFRSLKTTYKNLDANDILFDLSVLVDDIYISSTMGDVLILKNINSQEPDEIYYLTEQVSNAPDLVKHTPESLIQNIPVNKLTPSAFLQNNTKLFDFSAYSSNKIITHTTNIPSVGKFIELQLRFKSKGRFKLQSFALIYKEHSS